MNIEELRTQIDEVDDELLRLFEQRMELAKAIGEYKNENSLPIRNRERERKILYRMYKKAKPELSEYTRALFSSLFEMSSGYQGMFHHSDSNVKRLIEKAVQDTKENFPSSAVVACQGIEGAYSQAACDKLFPTADITYFDRFDGVFQAVNSGLCRYGILPLENSTAGSVNEVYDLMSHYQCYIVRSIKLPITHTLLAVPGVKISDIMEVFSHDQAIRQCSHFLDSMKEIKVTGCENTATAAKWAAESGRKDAAVISSQDCADLYGLSVLSYNIQNSDNNYTRFICIAKEPEIYPGACKTSLVLSLNHKPGTLYSVLAKFNAHGINLDKLESRPIAGQEFEFKFYFDIDTPAVSDDLKQMLSELEYETDMFHYMGTYQEF
ncbi:MAG: chorismate mutase [Lachnoclostridium sp.]|jgi:chorismate mutase/prephenate dehydratase|nr:chorismate mutase [Lachnoclostridium sp.]